ncbi:MAG: TraB/GumN family protein [Dissulfurispiraceae bacterium]
MRKRSKDIALFRSLLIVFLLNLASVHAVSASEKVFMWKIDSPKATVYILGTVHMMAKEMYPLDSRIESAFKKSDAYALEFNIDDVTKIQMDTMLSDISYRGDDTIRDHISTGTYKALQKKFSEYGLPFENMLKFRPWFLAITIETIEYQKLGLDPRYGIDKYLLQRAEGNKSIIELESFDSQMDLFRNMQEKDQELFLMYTLNDIDTSAKDMDVLLKAWFEGDANTVEKLMFAPLRENRQLLRIYEELFYERNLNMTDKIVKMLAQKGTYFVAVGAGHLVGSRGIIELLTHKGYTVTQQ